MAQTTISAVAVAAASLVLLLMPWLSAGGAAAVGDLSPAAIPIGMPKCATSCGGVVVPYPFGLGTDASCYLPGFNLTCDNTDSRPRLLLDTDGTLQVVQIVKFDVGALLKVQRNGDVKIDVDADGNGHGTFSRGLRHDGPYTLDSGNELILTGCNVQATVKSGSVTVASCTALCDAQVDYGYESTMMDRCSGDSTGCCRANIITPSYEDEDDKVYISNSTGTSPAYDVQLRWFGRNRSSDLERFPVRVFVAGHEWFDNTSVSNDLLQTVRAPLKVTMAVPVWLTWDVVGHAAVQPGLCKSNNSERRKSSRRGGYTCHCTKGYQGNPYLTDGCKDKDECAMMSQQGTEAGCHGECINMEGSFRCRCPPGTTGNYSIPGGCTPTAVALTGGCMKSCGDMKVPYPFGVGPSKCYWPGFGLVCDTSHDPPRLLLGSGQFRVIGISLPNSTIRVIRSNDLVPFFLLRPSMATELGGTFPYFLDDEAPYSLSTSNELVLIGCNVHATLVGHGVPAIISGCASFCSHNETGGFWDGRWPTSSIHGGNYCYGMGCCQTRISESIDGMPKKLVFKSVGTTINSRTPSPTFVFIAEEGWFNPLGVTGKLMREGHRPGSRTSADAMKVPILLRWEVLLLHNGSSSANVRSHPECDVGDQAAPRDLICKSKHSHCKRGNRGYTCQCNEDDGYHGNPYVPHGCRRMFQPFHRSLHIYTPSGPFYSAY